MGGGSCYDTLNNCVVTGNFASSKGGGASHGTLNNCSLTGNSASSGGGLDNCTLNNCIVYFNNASSGANHVYGTFNYSCTTPLPVGGINNFSADPLMASSSHLSAGSPCIGAGSSNYVNGVDIDGEPWQNPPCVGADQYVAGNATGALTMTISTMYTNVVAGFAVDFIAQNQGAISASLWDFARRHRSSQPSLFEPCVEPAGDLYGPPDGLQR